MSSQSTQRAELRRRIARHGLRKETLTLIAQALFGNLTEDTRLDDRKVHAVNDAIDTLALSGLSTDGEIADAIRNQRDSNQDDWRTEFWKERLALAADIWDAHVRLAQPPSMPQTSPFTVRPIPPQPPEEIGEAAGRSDPLAA